MGSLSPNYNGQAGAIDFGPDHDQLPQTSGPEERTTQHPIHTDPTAHGNASGTEAQNNSAGQDVSLSGVIETAAQQAAHKLQDAIIGDDPWGTRGRYEQAGNRPAGLAETAAQKAAHEAAQQVAPHTRQSWCDPAGESPAQVSSSVRLVAIVAWPLLTVAAKRAPGSLPALT